MVFDIKKITWTGITGIGYVVFCGYVAGGGTTSWGAEGYSHWGVYWGADGCSTWAGTEVLPVP